MPRQPRWSSVGLVALLALVACEDLHISAGDLDIGPNPAAPGDQVVATFILNLIPTQQHTIVLFIDEHEHMRQTRNEPPPRPVILELGDAADLIAEYGVGQHTVQVDVQVSSGSAHTEAILFELRDAEAAAGAAPNQEKEKP